WPRHHRSCTLTGAGRLCGLRHRGVESGAPKETSRAGGARTAHTLTRSVPLFLHFEEGGQSRAILRGDHRAVAQLGSVHLRRFPVLDELLAVVTELRRTSGQVTDQLVLRVAARAAWQLIRVEAGAG